MRIWWVYRLYLNVTTPKHEERDDTFGVSKVFWGQSKNEIKFGGTLFQLVKLGANFGGLK